MNLPPAIESDFRGSRLAHAILNKVSIFESIVLGLVQGLTEFIPVSSSGHLIIAQELLGGSSDHLFLEFINIGTVLALLIYFRKKIWTTLRDAFLNKNFTLIRNIILTTLPVGVIGFLAADFIDSQPFFVSSVVVIFALAIVGFVMVILEKIPKAKPRKGEKLSIAQSLLIGFAQTLALIPGASRSGTTIIAGRICGLKPTDAAEYSFLVSIPIMIGVVLKVFIKNTDYLLTNLAPLLVGNTVALLAGLLAVGFLMRFLSKHSLAVFGWYRIILATVLLITTLI